MFDIYRTAMSLKIFLSWSKLRNSNQNLTRDKGIYNITLFNIFAIKRHLQQGKLGCTIPQSSTDGVYTIIIINRMGESRAFNLSRRSLGP